MIVVVLIRSVMLFLATSSSVDAPSFSTIWPSVFGSRRLRVLSNDLDLGRRVHGVDNGR